MNPSDLSGIRVITVSGRIASGSTTLAKKLATHFHWRHIEGGEVFWEALRTKLGVDEKDTNLRSDQSDQDFDASLKKILKEGKNIVLETKLSGFNAQGIDGIFKILVLCNDVNGNDQTQIRIDRLVNREHVSMTDAKEEVLVREKNDIEKWQRLYAPDDPAWTYWNETYYDLVINSYSQDQDQAFATALAAIENK